MTEPAPTSPRFDFDEHRKRSEQQYQSIRHQYVELAEVVRGILQEALHSTGVRIASIQARAKGIDSFGEKAATPSEADPTAPKYPDPLTQITDLAAARVITFFPKTLQEVDAAIAQEFHILERADKGAALLAENRVGYQSIHYLVTLTPARTRLPEYARFAGRVLELQVRTILQHAWAEIEHDIQYKSEETMPASIRRRFVSLAGLLEIADREFQAIQGEDELLRESARQSFDEGQLAAIEITPDALKAYLDRRLGPDARMSLFSYDWTARMLLRLGFTNFAEIEEAIAPYNDDKLSRLVWGGRMGQVTRFETQITAAVGEPILERHPWGREAWFAEATRRRLALIQAAGLQVGQYRPRLFEVPAAPDSADRERTS